MTGSDLDPSIAARLKRDASGLVPAVVQQDDTGEVLMLAWMNDEALHRTLATGRATYFSRSRGRLWVKGETSGHHQYVRSVALDCDGDTLLVRVDQVGPACHTGARTCFQTTLVHAGQRPGTSSTVRDQPTPPLATAPPTAHGAAASTGSQPSTEGTRGAVQ